MFSNGSAYQFHGGNFYDVAGDLNIQVNSHLTINREAERPLSHPGECPMLEDADDSGERPSRRSGKQHDTVERSIGEGPKHLLQPESEPPVIPALGVAGSSPQNHSSEIRTHMDHGHSIHSGTYIAAGTVNHHYGEAGIHILHRAVALEALHDSADSFPQPRCHPETRTKMLDDLFRWATVTATEPNSSVLWLHGPAGAGKSAIMQTLCQRLHNAGRLGGSFFFKRGHATQGNAKALFSTLAYQLALHTQSVKSAISQIVEDDPSVVGRQMEVQLRQLILQPCQPLRGSAPPILLIDGLDECDTHSAQVEILRLVRDAARDHNLPVKILVASRPESHIRETIESSSFRGLYSCFNVEQSFDDIATYFRDEFSRIHREHHDTMGNVQVPWPSSETFGNLVARSDGYFIYASTVIKFIDDEYFRPTERLAIVEKSPDSTDYCDSPMRNLYELYIQILSVVPLQNRTRVGDILCVLTQFELSMENIEKLLKLEAGDGRLLLRGLCSLINITGDSVYTYHKSFLDFLENPQHASDFINLQTRKSVATYVLQAMSEEKWCTPVVAMDLQGLKYLKCITSIPPSSAGDLLPFVRLFNPDWLCWGQEQWSYDDDPTGSNWINTFLQWLTEVQPPPEAELIQKWEDYRFVLLYEHMNQVLHDYLMNTSGEQAYPHPFPPSFQVIQETQRRMKPTLQVSVNRLHKVLLESPILVRLLQARRLLGKQQVYIAANKRWLLDELRILWGFTWDDTITAVCSLRTITGEDPRKICSLLMVLPMACNDFYVEPLVSREVARRFLCVIHQIGVGTLHLYFWFLYRVSLAVPQWGQLIRHSPPWSTELLQDLRAFNPPWDVIYDSSQDRSTLLVPEEFHNVIEWLKAIPNPPLDLIEQWKGYLAESILRFSRLRNTDHDLLEAIWQHNIQVQAESYIPASDEGVVHLWEEAIGEMKDVVMGLKTDLS